MTEGKPSPRERTLAEKMNAAAALAEFDTAVGQLRSIAAWSQQELDLLRSDAADDRETMLDSWESLSTSLSKAVADLETANRRLDGLARQVVRDLIAGGAVPRTMAPPPGEQH